jgi:hypothetical protein
LCAIAAKRIPRTVSNVAFADHIEGLLCGGQLSMGIGFASGQGGEGGAKSSNVGGNNEDLSAWNGAEHLPRYHGLHQGWDFDWRDFLATVQSFGSCWELVRATGKRRER